MATSIQTAAIGIDSAVRNVSYRPGSFSSQVFEAVT